MLSAALYASFETHTEALKAARKRKQDDVTVKSHLETADQVSRPITVDEADETQYGIAMPEDQYAGDAHLRTLDALLTLIDKRGFERSSQQLDFHAAFRVACGRVLYKADWALMKPQICQRLGWTQSWSEVMVSVRHSLSPPHPTPPPPLTRADSGCAVCRFRRPVALARRLGAESLWKSLWEETEGV